MTTLEKIQLYTQERINNWYKNAKIDYGVVGWGEVSIDKDIARIKFSENNKIKVFEEKTLYLKEESIDYLFNIWSESY